jgi:hypothetical protein
LACELAARHFQHGAGKEKALDLFHKASKCYEKWGSVVKVDHIACVIASIDQ